MALLSFAMTHSNPLAVYSRMVQASRKRAETDLPGVFLANIPLDTTVEMIYEVS